MNEMISAERTEEQAGGARANSLKKLIGLDQSSGMHWVGDGFPVRSVFGYDDVGRELSPFLLLDYAPPTKFEPTERRRGVGAHPHRGFETVTVAYQGELEHRDSSGAGGKIGPGDVQWMTAAGGIVHEEFHSRDFARKGGILQMAQLWINLPAKHKNAKPGYQTIVNAQIPNVPLPQGAGNVRVIAGEYDGQKGSARTFTPINLWDVRLLAGGAAELPLPDGHTTAVLVVSGTVNVNGDQDAKEGDLAIFHRSGHGIALKARTDAVLLVMAGEPIDEPIVGSGPFVMNTREEIAQAFKDFQSGRMGQIPA
jgi:redox-sensitive bicupin YhaK (pirin superfamily)